MKAVLFHPRTRQATTIVLLLFAVATMWAAGQPAWQVWAEQARWIALGYLLAGMGLLLFRRTRLMFVCLGCSAAICLFFNELEHKNNNNNPACAEPVGRHDSTSYECTAPHQ